MRMLGGLLWVMIPLISIMLFLPHDLDIDYEMVLILLFFMLILNFTTLLLPFREKLLQRYFGVIMGIFSIALIGLICAGIYFTGGVRSAMFPFLLLVTAFSTSLFSSFYSTLFICGVSVGAYLLTLLVFSGIGTGDVQLVCSQVFFLLLTTFFVNRLGTESRDQAQERVKAMQELRSLSEMDRATSSFVSAVSFQMRTPLTSIQGFSEMLVRMDPDPRKEQEYVEIISREADNLSKLVEDLLDISRLESGKLRLNKGVARIEQLLEMSLPMLSPACEPQNLILSLPTDLPNVMVDEQRMKRVFDAVFGYITRKSGRGSEVRASVKTEGQEVVITINFRNMRSQPYLDNGGLLFPPLGGQDDEDLELAMARRIVLAHRGSVNLVRASGGWSAIVIRLPEPAAGDFITAASDSRGTFEETTA